VENQELIDQIPRLKFVSGLISIGLIGWLLMIFASMFFVFPPLGSLVLYDGMYSTYIDYSLFQTYANLAVLGLFLEGIGLFGFFLRFRKLTYLVASFSSFLATILIWRCKRFSDWSLSSSGYTWERINEFDLVFSMTAFVITLGMLLFGFGFIRMKDYPERLSVSICCIILSNGFVLFSIINEISWGIAHSSSLHGVMISWLLSIMIVGYLFALVLSGKGYSWIFKGVKPEPRTKEKYWW
jgi:hypothetical protein